MDATTKPTQTQRSRVFLMGERKFLCQMLCIKNEQTGPRRTTGRGLTTPSFAPPHLPHLQRPDPRSQESALEKGIIPSSEAVRRQERVHERVHESFQERV